MSADRAAEERPVEATLAEHQRSATYCLCGHWRAHSSDRRATTEQHRAHVAAALLAGPVGAALAAAKREAWGEGHMTHHDDNPCVTDENPYRAAGDEQ